MKVKIESHLQPQATLEAPFKNSIIHSKNMVGMSFYVLLLKMEKQSLREYVRGKPSQLSFSLKWLSLQA